MTACKGLCVSSFASLTTDTVSGVSLLGSLFPVLASCRYVKFNVVSTELNNVIHSLDSSRNT